MIIGEKNLILGTKTCSISEFSISVFYYITSELCFFIEMVEHFIHKIVPKCSSPPFNL